ncbi:hypothetical protein ALQ20_200107 [Pseudomonas syringae pv. atrofaciens]|nr:hypothetical protein ALQ20_200107 [Pseudomonas syringae pv. atrofaciens]
MPRTKLRFRSLALTSVTLSLMFVMVGCSSIATLVKAVARTFLRFLML